ncbi:hypothetical protein D3C81_2273000 [compost metagenome]
MAFMAMAPSASMLKSCCSVKLTVPSGVMVSTTAPPARPMRTFTLRPVLRSVLALASAFWPAVSSRSAASPMRM